MWYQFFIQNLHFALNVFIALILLAVTWLHFDSLSITKSLFQKIRTLGFFVLSLSFLFGSLSTESTLFPGQVLPAQLLSLIIISTLLTGYLLIAISVFTDPIQAKPKT
jgi:hypothetical protein